MRKLTDEQKEYMVNTLNLETEHCLKHLGLQLECKNAEYVTCTECLNDFVGKLRIAEDGDE